MKVVNIAYAMIKLQFKLPQTLISRGFTRRTVLYAPGIGPNLFLEKESGDIKHVKEFNNVLFNIPIDQVTIQACFTN